MPDSKAAAIVLAAGKGTRMKSSLPKVMHRIAGRTLIGHVLASLAPLDLARVIAVMRRKSRPTASRSRPSNSAPATPSAARVKR
jgi:bifunctional UDP-N-acetylglucosamine pyrophosphorylase / glucosamine-1-phosphate N-acetyltransferase